jgi:hypothetical protein
MYLIITIKILVCSIICVSVYNMFLFKIMSTSMEKKNLLMTINTYIIRDDL